MRGWKYEDDDEFWDVYTRRLLIACGATAGLILLVAMLGVLLT